MPLKQCNFKLKPETILALKIKQKEWGCSGAAVIERLVSEPAKPVAYSPGPTRSLVAEHPAVSHAGRTEPGIHQKPKPRRCAVMRWLASFI